MDNELDIAFALVRSAIDGTPIEIGKQEAAVWWNLFRLMQWNHVAALTAETAAALAVPREVLIPWLAECDKAERWHRYQQEVQQDILSVMAKHGIETLVLKGTHLAQYYPHPEQREFGDLDLYFYDRHGEADRLAREVLKVTVSNDAHHHSKYNYRGVTVESHYDFVNRHYPPSNRRYETLLKELAPSPTFEVLFLLRHMAGHFAASRLTLRDWVDWTLTCRALQEKVDWPLVQHTAAQYGMEPFLQELNHLVTQSPSHSATLSPLARDLVYGSVGDHAADGVGRLVWKMRRWKALRWKRQMVYSDSEWALLLSSLTAHGGKPRSILHKM